MRYVQKQVQMCSRMDELRREKRRMEMWNTSKGFGQTSQNFINARNARITMRRIESFSSPTQSDKENSTPESVI